jgi:dienelactone hydrolase
VAAAALTLASIAFSFVLPMFRLPRPTGRFPVGTRTLYLTDPGRSEMHAGAWPGAREVVVQLWYPSATAKGKKAAYRRWKETSHLSTYQAVLFTHSLQDAPVAAGRFPVVLYNPGWLGFRNRSTFMTQELASHGFIVAAISHPYNSSKVELAGGRIAIGEIDFDLGFSQVHYIPLDERLAKAHSELAIQVDDCRLVLSELERFDRTAGHPLQAHLRTSAMGAYGHSYGVAVSAELAKHDARIRAVLGLDGVLHGAVAEEGLAKPFMMIDSIWISSVQGHHDDSHPHRAAETTRMWKDIADSKAATLARHGGYRIVIDNVTHANFSDTGFMSPLRRFSEVGSLDHRLVARMINEYAVAFFRQTLLGENPALLAPGSPGFAEAPLEAWSSKAWSGETGSSKSGPGEAEAGETAPGEMRPTQPPAKAETTES